MSEVSSTFNIHSLSVKVAGGVVVVGIIGMLVATLLITRNVESDFHREFEDSRKEIARQIAGNIAGAVRWKKADVVSDAYKALIEDEKKPIAAVITVVGGDLLTQYADTGRDVSQLTKLAKSASEHPSTDVKTETLGDILVSTAPSGKDAKGNPFGYSVIAWRTDAIHECISNVKYSLVGMLALTILLIVVAILFLISKLITRPLGMISQRMVALAHSDIEAAVPYENRDDEIGFMAQSVVTFRDREIKRLQLEVAQVKEQEQCTLRQQRIEKLIEDFRGKVRNLLQDVIATMSNMQNAAGELTRTANNANEQATSASTTSKHASSNVHSVAAASEEMTQSIREISRSVHRTTAVASQANEGVGASTDRMTFLASAAQKIGTVVDLIRNISSQTNLLALNATIEAARAGEAGKGFAVVATEVKTLATQTAKATEEISAQINEIQASANDATQAMEGITLIMSEVNSLATSIAAAIEEQTTTTVEISRNVSEAADGTSSVADNIYSVANAIRRTVDVATEVDSTANIVRTAADELNHTVDFFLREVAAA